MKSSTVILLLCLSSAPLWAADTPQEIQCLAEAMYFEARGEGKTGQEAVALVTLNRTRTPNYPKTVCGVVYQKGQYSWARKKHKVSDKVGFARIKELASDFYLKFHNGDLSPALKEIKSALYFTHGRFKGLKMIGKIGNHNFFAKR
jgi:hypothetical protein